MEGWLKLHRKIMDSAVFKNSKTLHVWIWCLCKATHTEYEELIGNTIVPLHAGQFVSGRKKAAIELSMPESTVRDQLTILKRLGMISIKPTNKYSVITVENWGVYQGLIEDSRQQNDSKATANRHIQKGKEHKKEFTPPTVEEVAAYCEERGNSISPEAFIDYYAANGWVQGKGRPIKDWKAAVRTWERRQNPQPAQAAEKYHV